MFLTFIEHRQTDEDEMARKKERILMSVIKRKEQQEASRARKELEAAKRREQERYEFISTCEDFCVSNNIYRKLKLFN